MVELYQWFTAAIGADIDPEKRNALHICLRVLIVFFALLVMTRLANKRFLAKITAFDVILALILASMLARTINGSAPMLPTLAGGIVIVLIHRLLAFVASRTRRFGPLIKGHHDLLIENGKVMESALRKHNLSQEDLLEELRLNGKVNSPQAVSQAILERNGEISVITKPS